MAQDEGRAIGQDEFELAVPDLGIQQVHAGGVDSTRTSSSRRSGSGISAKPQSALLLVPIDDEGLHGFFLQFEEPGSRVGAAVQTGRRNCLRKLLSNISAGAKRRSMLTCRAALPAV